MKVNLLCAEGELLNGYTNISPLQRPDTLVADMGNFDQYVDDYEVEHMVATEVLSYYTYPQAIEILRYWCRKLSIGGKLTITNIDSYTVGLSYIYGQLGQADFSNCLFNGKKSAHSIISVAELLEKQPGITIIRKLLNGNTFVIEVEKTQ